MPYTKEYREANIVIIKERLAKSAAKYAANHPDRVKKQKQEWYRKDPEKTLVRVAKWRRDNPENEFNGHLRRKYGLTREAYDQLLACQQSKCGICKGPPVGRVKNGLAKRLVVDHDHTTGKVRGLVCHPCNVMLGLARDNVDTLYAAILWLSR